MKASIVARITLVSWAGAIVALAAACGSPAGSEGSAPAIDNAAPHAESLACVHTRPADPTSLSDALAACGCSATPVHVDGCSERWSASDCSSADPACVNAVLDTNGYRSAPWDAFTTSIGSCISYAVVYDPCGGICRVYQPISGGTNSDWCPSLKH